MNAPEPSKPAPAPALKSLPTRIWTNNWSRTALAALMVGAVLALSGGFGTGDMPVAVRLAYWLTLVSLGIALGRYGGRRLLRDALFDTRPFLAGALMVAVIALPMTLVATLVNGWMHGQVFRSARFWDTLPAVMVVTSGMVALAFMVQRHDKAETRPAPKGAPPPAFLARMPTTLRGATLWAVQAEDHYLRLHTSAGQDLILMRLVDALGELEGIEGAQTHRSWWVAREAVQGAEREDGRATLLLPGGLRAPVSRAHAKRLGAAGWF